MQVYDRTLIRRLLIGFVSFLTILAVILVANRLLTSSTIKISSSDHTQIFVRQGDQDFKQIGTGQATYKTRDTDIVYAEARQDGQVSQKSVQPERRKTVSLTLELKPLAKAEAIAGGPLIDMFFTNSYIYGINPDNGSLTARGLGADNNDPGPLLPLLPKLLQIVWADSNNFYYATTTRRGGLVQNGQPLVQEERRDAPLPYYAAAQINNSSLGLLSNDGLYLANGVSGVQSARKISGLTKGTSPAIFSDSTRLYLTELVYKSGGDSEDEGLTEDPISTNLVIFDSNGKQTSKFSLPLTERTMAIGGSSDALAVLSAGNVMLVNTKTGQSRNISFSFGNVEDLVIYKDRVLLLGSSGLWQLNPVSGEYTKVATYPKGEDYVRGSLQNTNGNLYFSTVVSEETLSQTTTTTAQSSIYKLVLP